MNELFNDLNYNILIDYKMINISKSFYIYDRI
jgi:hypothetical protein